MHLISLEATVGFWTQGVQKINSGRGTDMLGKIHRRYSEIPPIESAWKSAIPLF